MQNVKNRECEELIDKEICDKAFIWNPSYCKCECDKPCDVGEYLDYEICKYRKRLIDKLVKECIKILVEMKWFIIKLYMIMKRDVDWKLI